MDKYLFGCFLVGAVLCLQWMQCKQIREVLLSLRLFNLRSYWMHFDEILCSDLLHTHKMWDESDFGSKRNEISRIYEAQINVLIIFSKKVSTYKISWPVNFQKIRLGCSQPLMQREDLLTHLNVLATWPNPIPVQSVRQLQDQFIWCHFNIMFEMVSSCKNF
jgi:hypothetical protein